MAPNRHWIAPALYMAMLIALSSIPGSTGPDAHPGPINWIPSIVSNALHVPAYAGLGFLWARTLTKSGDTGDCMVTVLALIIAAAFGAIDELYQGFIPGRMTTPADWAANAVGATLGCVVFLYWQRSRTHSK